MSEDLQIIKYKLMHPDAKAPVRMTAQSVGYDLATVEGKMLYPGDSARLDTGVQFFFSYPNYIQLNGRSSVFERGLVIHNGIVDPDYQDTVKVLARNIGRLPIHIQPGDRLMQFVLQRGQVLVDADPGKYEVPPAGEQASGDSQRTDGDRQRVGGFGSTGR